MSSLKKRYKLLSISIFFIGILIVVDRHIQRLMNNSPYKETLGVDSVKDKDTMFNMVHDYIFEGGSEFVMIEHKSDDDCCFCSEHSSIEILGNKYSHTKQIKLDGVSHCIKPE